ncbi:alpha/beta hydrolase [Fulvivirga ligni]|uniref:alpha/beta hydrolase n=1 Tax=Fulvivirga ligni TaxID=2904246 RepID=UPI001F38DE40|nr:alpha/beta hydrolase [Fulvivirga ligni]UII20478.1 alpha/beta hydrolase [Fulvivirga ligni]
MKSKKFKTSEGLKIEGEVGYLEVSENRKDPSSRKIQLKYIHLKSLSENPATPVVYLEGGGGMSTWEAESPKDLHDRIDILEVADLIFLDRRGSSDEALTYIWQEDFPADFFVSEEIANKHYQKLAKAALEKFSRDKVDVTGYNIEEHAKDVNDLMTALGLDTYTIFGFSFGTHIGMTVMELYPDRVDKAILVGADAPNQAFNFPQHLDAQVKKIGHLIEKEGTLNMTAGEFEKLLRETMQKLKEQPVSILVKNPLTKKEIELKIGDFGLALVLRLDIDDYYDIPVIPRLLYSINTGDYSLLTWFVQKRISFAIGLPGQGINQQLASGSSQARWSEIQKEAQESIFGNVVNFPFSAVKDHWPTIDLSFDPSIPIKSEIPTLFITGTLDCRTPVQQVEETIEGFVNAIHVQVENAGHEQAQWDADVANKIVPTFLKGETNISTNAYYSEIEFIQLTGKASGHPSIK